VQLVRLICCHSGPSVLCADRGVATCDGGRITPPTSHSLSFSMCSVSAFLKYCSRRTCFSHALNNSSFEESCQEFCVWYWQTTWCRVITNSTQASHLKPKHDCLSSSKLRPRQDAASSAVDKVSAHWSAMMRRFLHRLASFHSAYHAISTSQRHMARYYVVKLTCQTQRDFLKTSLC